MKVLIRGYQCDNASWLYGTQKKRESLGKGQAKRGKVKKEIRKGSTDSIVSQELV